MRHEIPHHEIPRHEIPHHEIPRHEIPHHENDVECDTVLSTIGRQQSSLSIYYIQLSMANFCEQCRNIVFIPRIIDNERDFEAVIHPSLSALEKSAASNWCSFCNVLLGMIEHHRRNEHVTHTSLPTETISLFLQLPCDEGNDWEILHDSTDSVEEARYLRFHHPFGGDAFRILNPEVLTLSETSHRAQAGSSAEGYHFEHAAISSEDTSTGSDEALAVARRWLDTCRNTHQICETPRDHAYGAFEVPSRLLDVSNATVHDGSVFLVSTPQIQRPQYATLSHRWDPNESCLLTTVNERALMLQGILVNQLPRKFADASITAHKLGLQYIWIDSLCILQDSDADKAKQIPQMGSFYENAEVNLSASSDGLGMWKERNGRVTRPFGLAVTINDPNLDAGYARVILKVTPLIRCRRSHLESRVWILQERIFARRTLFF